VTGRMVYRMFFLGLYTKTQNT